MFLLCMHNAIHCDLHVFSPFFSAEKFAVVPSYIYNYNFKIAGFIKIVFGCRHTIKTSNRVTACICADLPEPSLLTVLISTKSYALANMIILKKLLLVFQTYLAEVPVTIRHRMTVFRSWTYCIIYLPYPIII